MIRNSSKENRKNIYRMPWEIFRFKQGLFLNKTLTFKFYLVISKEAKRTRPKQVDTELTEDSMI